MDNNAIIKFIESGSTLSFEETSDGRLQFSTRAHGDVCEGEYSPIDKAETKAIALQAIKHFGNIKASMETVDEFVMLYISPKLSIA